MKNKHMTENNLPFLLPTDRMNPNINQLQLRPLPSTKDEQFLNSFFDQTHARLICKSSVDGSYTPRRSPFHAKTN